MAKLFKQQQSHVDSAKVMESRDHSNGVSLKNQRNREDFLMFVLAALACLFAINTYGQELERGRKRVSVGKYVIEMNAKKNAIDSKYTDVRDFSEGLAAIEQFVDGNFKWGFIDKTGKEVIPFKFQEVKSFSDDLAAVKLKGKWGFIDKAGKAVIPFDFQEAKSFSEGLAAAQLYNNKWVFIDTTGKAVTSSEFRDVRSFSEGLAAVKLKGKWGFIDKNSNAVVPIVYKAVSDFSNGYAVVQDGRFLGAVDKNGTVIAPCIYSNIYSVNAVIAKEKAAQLEREKNAALEREKTVALEREKTAQKQEVTNSSSANAPDIILLKNGSEIKAKIDEITLSEIKYKQFDYLDGPTRTVAKSDALVIIHANGTREVVSATTGANTGNASNRAGEVSIGFSPVIYVQEDLFMFGFCGKLRVGIANPIRLEGSFTYHLPKTKKLEFFGYEIETKVNMWDVNLDMQAIVTKSDKFLLYPLIGLRVFGMKGEGKALGESDSDSETFFGLNSGFGFDVKLSDKVFFNLESKYKLSFVEKETVSGFTASMGLIIKF